MCFNSLSTTLQSKFSKRTLMVFNIIAAALILTCIALRFYYFAAFGDAGNNVVFFIVLAIY